MISRRNEIPSTRKVSVSEFLNPYFFYVPVGISWLWYALRSRQLMFGTSVNPAIKNAGLFHFSKQEINAVLPEKHRVESFTFIYSDHSSLEKALLINGIQYPFVIKPDNGLRGIDVHIIQNKFELESISLHQNTKYLVEDYIDYQNEFGVFISRKKNGKLFITGVTQKVYPMIEGDGVNRLIDLLKAHPRYKKSYHKFPQSTHRQFHKTPLRGEQIELSRIGNHNRGTMFLDVTATISDKVIQQLLTHLEKIEGIDYGRFDIKFSSVSDLEESGSFKIIEFNGVMAEPTHIYDPDYNFLQAVACYTRHIRYLHEAYHYRSALGHRPLGIVETIKELKLHQQNRSQKKRAA